MSIKESVGVCLGASTVSFVRVRRVADKTVITDSLRVAHNGAPKETFKNKLKEFNPDKAPVVVTGRKFRNLVKLTKVPEPEAIERSVEFLGGGSGEYSAVASLGGETFIVYLLDEDGKVSNIFTKNQCASGTGEFFMQQLKRMNVDFKTANELAEGAKPHRVSGRCSVFCKSDCTHALNKGAPVSEVTAGLALMMAEKVEELLKKVHDGKKLLTGGVTKNKTVMDYVEKLVDKVEIPDSAPYFEALGASLYALDNYTEPIKSFEDILSDKKSSFVFHKPLRDFEDKVIFKKNDRGRAKDGDECILGLDVGSTTTKAVIIRTKDDKILGSVYLYTLGAPVRAARQCYAELLKQIPQKIDIVGLGTTGSGRHIAGMHALTEGVFNEIIAHATAAVYFDPEVDTIFEIGGQDAKYTYLFNKVPGDYAMNEACSAGTGSFIEEAAYESFRIDVEDIEDIAMRGGNPPNFNDQCAAFISSDIKTALHENISTEDIVAGLVYSICLNYVNRVKGNRPVGDKIFMQGGVCYNKAVPIAMAALTEKEIIVPPDPGLMGAFGVALEVKEKIELGLLDKKEFDLKELLEREVKYKKPFICPGGKEKCDLGCEVNRIVIEGKTYPFGGACDKYYGVKSKANINAEDYDFVKKRQRLLFGKYAPPADLPEDAKTVGINLSFHTYNLYPLYYNFFTKLGFKVVLPDGPDDDGLEREATSFCYPGQLSLCMFQDLLRKDTDYLFVPNILEMHVNKEEHYRIDNNATCVFVISEPYFLREAYKDYDLDDKWISPKLNFASGFDAEEDKFIEVAKELGVKDAKKARESYRYAVKKQNEFREKLFSIGTRFLEYLEKNPDKYAIVIFGRTYNSYTDTANKNIPQKFASRGVYVLPLDMFDYRNETIDGEMYWEGGKKIMKAAKIIKRHPQLFGTYITNFSCGPDSMIMTPFRTLMGVKPSLTLELDGHTADAGINTRIDAALDIIKNYRKVQSKDIKVDEDEFQIAQVLPEGGKSVFITSDGEKIPLTDKRVKVLVPSMGDLSSRLFASTMRAMGFNAEALPEGNSEILKYGRANLTGKECLPLILLVGSLLDYIENRWDGEEYIALFNVKSAGSCRLGLYHELIENVIKRKKLSNVASFILMTDDGYAGLGSDFAKYGILTLLASDVMDDIRSAIMANAADPDYGLKIFFEEFEKVERNLDTDVNKFYRLLENFAEAINKKVPAKRKIEDSKYIALLGEIYVRSDDFSHRWLNKVFAKKGFIVSTAYITEWIYYIDYLIKLNLIEPDKSIAKKTEQFIRQRYMRGAEKKIKKILEKTGYYEYEKTEVEPLLKHSKHIIPYEVKGEPGLTLGTYFYETLHKYCGIINLGPFGCMPTRFSESVALPNMKMRNKEEAMKLNNSNYRLPEIYKGSMNLPFLTIETDGNVYPQVIEARLETFALQADRVARLMNSDKTNGKAKAGLFKKLNIFNKIKT